MALSEKMDQYYLGDNDKALPVDTPTGEVTKTRRSHYDDMMRRHERVLSGAEQPPTEAPGSFVPTVTPR